MNLALMPAARRTLLVPLLMCAPAQASTVDTLTLQNDSIRLELTPQLGGRVLWFSRQGQPNVLKIGEPVAMQPDPVASATADNIGYLGHEVWLGPQSQWWTQQSLNPTRRDAGANWPPDPYLAFPRNRVLAQDSQSVLLQGQDSPVSGIRLSKQFRLSAQREDTIEVIARADNIRDVPVAWDLWFNTRSHAFSQVYVPVENAHDVALDAFPGVGVLPIRWQHRHGLLTLEQTGLPAGASGWRGKLRMQPSDGWMAGFVQGQMLLIRFAHLSRDRIHPEQGQVELYLDKPRDADSGLLEMEIHGAYRRLAPGESMTLREQWTLLRYDGAATAVAQRAFLCAQAEALQITMECTDAASDVADSGVSGHH